MHCRTNLLLERDFQELMDNGYKGIIAFPVSEDMMQWEAEIEGLQHSVWHGLFFQVSVTFTSEYNLVPPEVRFITIPFHPNVDRHTGRPCIDFLDDPNQWDTSYKLSSILLTLQVMLSNPVLENPVNLEAAQMLIDNESLYQMTVLQLFGQPLQLRVYESVPSEKPQEFVSSRKAVSFNDYYKKWSVTATSKVIDFYRTSVLQGLDIVDSYHKWMKVDLKHPEKWNFKCAATLAHIARRNETLHMSSMGGIRTSLTSGIFSPETQMETDIVTNISEDVKESGSILLPPVYEYPEMPREEEVEDLVSWANTLNTDTLED